MVMGEIWTQYHVDAGCVFGESTAKTSGILLTVYQAEWLLLILYKYVE